MNRQQALSNALAAVSYMKADALNQQRLARELDNESLEAFWQKEADEAEQTYNELFTLLGECNEPQASPGNSPDRSGETPGHSEDVAGTGDTQRQQQEETRSPVHHQRAGGEPEGYQGGSARSAELAAGAVTEALTTLGECYVQP